MSTAKSAAAKITHIIIVVKENHTYDNYFGTYPNSKPTLPHAPNPPLDHNHSHDAWLHRDTKAVREQFLKSDIPAYFAYAKLFTLCSNYFTEVAGPSTPNHLMILAANSPFIDNPHKGEKASLTSSVPHSLDAHHHTWGNYGGYAFQYLKGLSSKNKFTSDKFAIHAKAGKLPNVSWLYGPTQYDEHPKYGGKNMGNVTVGSQWTVDQINAIVKGGLWRGSAIFVTWDDWGAWYDHITPPKVESWPKMVPKPSYKGTQFRYGSRVGCLVMGPYAKRNYLSKKLHSHVSLVKFVETVFGLPTLNDRDRKADDMMDCFDFSQKPSPPPPSRP